MNNGKGCRMNGRAAGGPSSLAWRGVGKFECRKGTAAPCAGPCILAIS
jgi:hypothetical protein